MLSLTVLIQKLKSDKADITPANKRDLIIYLQRLKVIMEENNRLKQKEKEWLEKERQQKTY